MIYLMTLALAAAQSPAPARTGVTLAAPATTKGQPATFDLAGFRLGMSEAEVERVLRSRGMTVRRRARGSTFEDNVRGLVNVRGGRLPLQGEKVLESAEFDDGKGGKVMLRMLPWPDGARVRGVVYLPPAGTKPASWRALLVERFGAPARDSDRIDGEGLHAAWCGQSSCSGEGGRFRLGVDVNAQGGQIELSQPEGTAQTLEALVEDAAVKRGKVGTPAP
ncbi:hypothetical protein ACYZX9_11315 [Sphingomonas citri]